MHTLSRLHKKMALRLPGKQFLFWLIVLNSFSASGRAGVPSGAGGSDKLQGKNSSGFFIENKGQLLDDQGNPATEVLYYCQQAGYNLYFTRNALVYEFYERKSPSGRVGKASLDIPVNSPKPEETALRKFRLDMRFSGINPSTLIKSGGKRSTYHNYYRGGDVQSEFKEVGLFDTLFYRDIYPSIDLQFYLLPEGKGMKYDFIVHPGGDPSQISYTYVGADLLSQQKSGDLHIITPLGTLREEKPYSYQEIEGKTREVASAFRLKGKQASFELGKYASANRLVIDPSILVWSSYYGGSGTDEEAGSMSSDAAGNVIVCGNTNSPNFPTSAGVVQTASAGMKDGFIFKFDANGNRLWGTYFGGSKDDFVRSVKADGSNSIFAIGTTYSLNLPLKDPGGGAFFLAVNAASTNKPTNPTAFVLRLNPTGTLYWASYFGGNVGENGVEVSIDANNNVLFAGCSASTSDFPVTAGAFQSVMAGPYSGVYFGDVFVAKFSNSCVQQWTTLIGGSEDDIGYGLTSDASGDVYLVGYTASANFPVSAGAFQSSFAGGFADMVFARFSSTGTRIWSTYYGGTGSQRGLDIRAVGNHLYAVGYSSNTLPGPTGSVFQPNNAGGPGDAVLIKLEKDASASQVVWRTFCGGSGDDGFDELEKNSAGNLVCGGWTNSPNYPASTYAYQKNLGAGYDGQIATIDPDGKLICATYFGGTGPTENVYGLAVAANDDVFCTGNVSSSPAQGFVVSPGAFQASKGAGLDSYIARLSYIPPAPLADFTANPSSGCSPLTVSLNNLSQSINTCLSNTTWEWSFPGGNPANSNVEDPPTVQYTTPGSYTITLKVSNLSGSHTATKTIEVSADLPITLSPDITICNGNSTNLIASGAESYTWSPASGLSSTSGANVTANPSVSTTYTVTGSNSSGCSGTASVTVTVSPGLTATVSPDIGICSGGSTTLTAGGGSSYSWSPATGLSSTSGASVTASPASTTTYTVTVTGGGCPAATASVTVSILPAIVPTVSDDVQICSGGSGTTLTAGGGSTYSWSPSTGLSSSTGETVTANPALTTTYTVTVSSGTCPPASANVTVTVIEAPQASVSPDITICQGEQANLTASGGDTYSWSPPEGLNTSNGPSVIAQPSGTTTYTLTASRTGCPSSTAQVTVRVIPVSPPDAGEDTGICPGGFVVLQGTGADSYIWSPPDGLSCTDCPNPVARPESTTTYSLRSGSGECTTGTDMITVYVWELPTASAGEPQSVPRGQSLTLNASGGVAYRWISSNSTGESLVVSPQSNAVYCVEATDIHGCTDTACVNITVTEPLVSSLWIPSCFTPNGDRVNSLFQTPGENIIEYHAYIYNRWGELIFDWRDISQGWDGTYRGAPVQDDVYAYRVRALGIDGIKYNKTGMLLIIK